MHVARVQGNKFTAEARAIVTNAFKQFKARASDAAEDANDRQGQPIVGGSDTGVVDIDALFDKLRLSDRVKVRTHRHGRLFYGLLTLASEMDGCSTVVLRLFYGCLYRFHLSGNNRRDSHFTEHRAACCRTPGEAAAEAEAHAHL